jgi:hypothetical protein
MKKVILLSCDGVLVDIEEVFLVNDYEVDNMVSVIFNRSVKNSDVEDIMEWELSKEDIDYSFVEREFECGNEWNSIVVVDGNLEELNFN